MYENNRGCRLPPLHYIESNVINPALEATGISTVTKTIGTIFEDIGKLFTPDTSTDTARTKKRTSNSTPNRSLTRKEYEETCNSLNKYNPDHPDYITNDFKDFLDKKLHLKNPKFQLLSLLLTIPTLFA